MKELALMEVVKATHAIDYTAKDRTIQVKHVAFDARLVQAGGLFIPLTGGQTDGHTYIQQAIDNGAVATLWSRDAQEAPTDDLAVVFVDDTLQAMQDLAAYYRQLIDPIVVGITGSNGKTTTKDMTAMTLKAKYQTHHTQGNYNNEIGLPATILSMPADTQVLVLELGMSAFGEIELLSRIAQPDLAAITLIGESHMEHLGSRRGIAQAKLEILVGLKEGGTLIYPQAEPLLQELLEEAEPSFKRQTFGFSQAADVYAYDLVEEADRTFFRTNLDESVVCMIPVLGQYNVGNALVALSIAQALGVPLEQAIFQLSQFKLTANRLEWLRTPAGITLLNDAYNASPTSMRAVLASFSGLKSEETYRKVLVLGDIRELGPDSAAYHADLADAIDPAIIDRVYLFGSEMNHLYQALKPKFQAADLFYEVDRHDQLIHRLREDLSPQDVVLLKSSFGVDLLQVVQALMQA